MQYIIYALRRKENLVQGNVEATFQTITSLRVVLGLSTLYFKSEKPFNILDSYNVFYVLRKKNLFNNLNSLNYSTHRLFQNLSRLTWEIAVSYSRVFTVLDARIFKLRIKVKCSHWCKKN